MNKAKSEPNQSQSIADTVARYARLVDERDGPAMTSRAMAEKIVQLTGGRDVAAIAAEDPAKARRVAAEIAALQVDMLIAQAALDRKDEELDKLAPVLYRETCRLNEERDKLRNENFERVVAQVVDQLGALKLWEGERLRRLAFESLPVRAEDRFNRRFDHLPKSGYECDWRVIDNVITPVGGEMTNARAVLVAYEASLAAYNEVCAHAEQLKRDPR